MEENPTDDAAILELRERMALAEGNITRLDQTTSKLEAGMNELRTAVGDLRVAIATVATKDDIASLRNDINKMFTKQLSDANAAVPAKIGLILTAGTVIVMVMSLVVSIVQLGH